MKYIYIYIYIYIYLYESRELILNVFKSRMFPIKETKVKSLKTLTTKQMPIALT